MQRGDDQEVNGKLGDLIGKVSFELYSKRGEFPWASDLIAPAACKLHKVIAQKSAVREPKNVKLESSVQRVSEEEFQNISALSSQAQSGMNIVVSSDLGVVSISSTGKRDENGILPARVDIILKA